MVRLKVLFYGLEAALADELKATLTLHDVFVVSEETVSACVRELLARTPDVLFCGSHRMGRVAALKAIAMVRSATPVIVASRQPETSEWLDALEAGAADYCSAPFETHQIGWILDSTVRRKRAAAVA